MGSTGKFVLRVQHEAHKRLKELARLQSMSMNQYVGIVLNCHLQLNDLPFNIAAALKDDLFAVIDCRSGPVPKTDYNFMDVIVVLKNNVAIDRRLILIWSDEVVNGLSRLGSMNGMSGLDIEGHPSYAPIQSLFPIFKHLPSDVRHAEVLWKKAAQLTYEQNFRNILYEADSTVSSFLKKLNDFQRNKSKSDT